MPDEEEVAGLLALQLLVESRRRHRGRGQTVRSFCSKSKTERDGIGR